MKLLLIVFQVNNNDTSVLLIITLYITVRLFCNLFIELEQVRAFALQANTCSKLQIKGNGLMG